MRDRAQQRELSRLNLSASRDYKASVADTEQGGINTGGYIVIDLQDDLRSTFTDLLNGFEDFAKLKGYGISFSVDNSIPNKIGFKFTILENGVGVSTQTVRKDINEYILRVQKGDAFDDLPRLISDQEHIVVSTALKNRINFLSHSYNLEKNLREAYERALKQVNQIGQGFSQQPSIFIQTGGVNTPRSLVAHNSNNVLLGEEISNESSSNIHTDNSIQITNSFNKRKEQIQHLNHLLELLKQENKEDKAELQDLIINFAKIKDELEEQESPDKMRIQRWLSITRTIVERIVLSHEASQAVQWIYNNLGFLT
jgi:hypothetical protein